MRHPALLSLVLGLLALGPGLDGSPTEALARHEFRRSVMGTEARLVLYAPSAAVAREAGGAAFERMLAIEAVASDWIADSELSRLGRAAGTHALAISDPLFEVLTQAREVAARTGGRFDPTSGPLTQLWRQHRAAHTLPAQDELEAARALVDWRALELDAEHRTARLARPGMRLDLGGIAKGYACDAALAVLEEHGCGSALVELGGDLVVGAPPPEQAAWSITIDCGSGAEPRELLLVRQAVATSGDAFQFTEVAGERYSHVLDTGTGLGLRTGLCTTVVAPTGALADALATALNVAGPAAGSDLAGRFEGVRLAR